MLFPEKPSLSQRDQFPSQQNSWLRDQGAELRRAARYSVFYKRESMLEEEETPSHPLIENSFSIERSVCEVPTQATSITSFHPNTSNPTQIKFVEAKSLPQSESPLRVGKFKVRIFNGEMSETQKEVSRLREKERNLIQRNRERRTSVAISESLSAHSNNSKSSNAANHKSSKFKPKPTPHTKENSKPGARRLSSHQVTQFSPFSKTKLPPSNHRSCNCASMKRNALCPNPTQCSCVNCSLPASLGKCSRTRLGLYSHPERTLQAILERGKESGFPANESRNTSQANVMLGGIIALASLNNIMSSPSLPPVDSKTGDKGEEKQRQKMNHKRKSMICVHEDLKSQKAIELSRPALLTENEKEQILQREMDLQAELIAESKKEEYVPLSKIVGDVKWKFGIKGQIAREVRHSLLR